MNRSTLECYRCPHCHSEALTLEASEEVEDRVITGTLKCTSCSAQFPIRNAILNFLDRGVEGHTEKVSEIFSKDFVETYRRRWSKCANALTERALKDLLADGVKGLEGKRALDMGAGFGKFSKVLLEQGLKSIAVDLSEDMLKAGLEDWTDEEKKNIDLVVADLTNLPFKEGVFDAFICINVYQYLEDPDTVLKEAHRACSSSARFVMHLLNCLDLRGKYLLFKTLLSFKKWIVGGQMMEGYRNLYASFSMKSKLKASRLQMTGRNGVNLFLPIEDQILNRIQVSTSLGQMIFKFKRGTDALFRKIWPINRLFNAEVIVGQVEK